MDINLNYAGNVNYDSKQEVGQVPEKNKRKQSLEAMVRNIHKRTHEDKRVRSYFHERGINNASIDRFRLGIWKFGGYDRFVIPVLDKTGKVVYLKLRITPADEPAETLSEVMGQETSIKKYEIYPTNAAQVLVGEDELRKSTSSDVLICKSELDRIIAIQEGVKMPVVTGGGLVQSFRKEWIDSLKNARNIYLCLGESAVGKRGATILAKRLAEHIPSASIYMISLPFEDNVCADLTDYFVEKRGTTDELFNKYAKCHCGAEPIDVSTFKEMTVDDVANVLDSTIKNNRVNKVITFLAMLLAYTEDSQLNVMFNAQSSTGKTYITLEASKYFPAQDVKVYGRTSKTAFYYNTSLMKSDDSGGFYIDLERRILVFAEQPDMQLLENLRSFLSHDLKKTPFILTNKSKNGRNTAEEGYILGFSSTIFCSANMRIDEQEQTRSLILSPESTEETVRAGVDESIARNSNKDAYNTKLDANEARRALMERVLYIKNLSVGQINIDDSEYLKTRFYEKLRSTPPRVQRQIGHFISLVKGIALLNAPFRMVGDKIIATNKDVDEAMKLWSVINESMFYGVPPQALDFYKNFVIPAYRLKNKTDGGEKGITYDELAHYHFEQTGNYPNLEMVRKMFIPALQCASLISYEKDDDDKRQMLIKPMVFFDNTLEK
ncbi:hypothetical protein J6X73_01245 [Candidatus Saccharibacteria bacterium]|nr:hypothetical protein [Candidatus Saccharibacteria bacterium]